MPGNVFYTCLPFARPFPCGVSKAPASARPSSYLIEFEGIKTAQAPMQLLLNRDPGIPACLLHAWKCFLYMLALCSPLSLRCFQSACLCAPLLLFNRV